MTGALLLAGYAVAAGWLAPAALDRGWAPRSPRLAISLWLALAISWIAAAALAILTAAAPLSLSWTGTGGGPGLPAAPGVTGPSAVSGAGLLLAAAMVARAAGWVAAGLARGGGERRAHSAFLAAAGRPDPALGAVVLDDDAPAAYCLPGVHPRVVVSAGALAALGPGQLRAVLAHERAHLRGRHHLILATASGLGRAFRFVPLLARASGQVAVLAEMAADDAAARRHDPGDLAAAVVILATAGARTTVLTAGGPAAIARVQRLLAPPRPGRPARTAGLAAGGAALLVPAAIALLPLIAAACDLAART